MTLLLFLCWASCFGDKDLLFEIKETNELIELNYYEPCNIDYYCSCQDCLNDNDIIEIFTEQEWIDQKKNE